MVVVVKIEIRVTVWKKLAIACTLPKQGKVERSRCKKLERVTPTALFRVINPFGAWGQYKPVTVTHSNMARRVQTRVSCRIYEHR